MITILYLSGGLFLGWSLGANDAANIFGTAVGTKMVRFRTAALIASVFLVLGAVISGRGASLTLTQLGSVNKIAGAFIVVLATAFTVFWMTRLRLPVSTSQAIVGSIIGWNLFSGMLTNLHVLSKIVGSWILSLLLAGIFAFLLYKLLLHSRILGKIHLYRLDAYTRFGLLLIGAFGAYSLGANNIANVMGVFVPISPFHTIRLGPLLFTGVQQLFLLSGLAIAVGVYTYSYRVMVTVGQSIFKLTPQAALIVVFAESLVLFLFASQGLHNFLISIGLPAFPLVPVSSSQLVIGAVIGIGLARNARNIKYRVAGKIIAGWIATPLFSGLFCLLALFIWQNVFNQEVFQKRQFDLNDTVIHRLAKEGISLNADEFEESYDNEVQFIKALHTTGFANSDTIQTIFRFANREPMIITPRRILQFENLGKGRFSQQQFKLIKSLSGKSFNYFWELEDALKSQCRKSKVQAFSDEQLKIIYQHFYHPGVQH
jgi:PiT family inorganic phosphate transporter